MRARRLAAMLAAIVAAALAASSAQARVPAAPYGGLGAWISLYTPEWRNPAAAVGALASRGISTIYLETGRSTSPAALERPTQTAAFLDAAHAAGVAVVAWYYPTFRNWRSDASRALATARFQTLGGQSFDGVAVDIEDPSVRDVSARNARLIAFTRAITSALPDEPWGAITYPPIGLDLNPHAWPRFPWVHVASSYSAILPMAYWRTRTRTAAGAAWYAAGNLAALRVLTGRSDLAVHLIGSGGTAPAEALAFATAAVAGGSVGYSLYPAVRIDTASWGALQTVQTQQAAVGVPATQ
jgi:hypothetical protein